MFDQCTETENVIQLPESWKSWTITQKIGAGSFGCVYLAEKEGEKSAIKIISIPDGSSERTALLVESKTEEIAHKYLESLLQDYSREIRALYALQDNPHIVKIEDHLIEEISPLEYRILIRMELLTPLRDYFAGMSITEEDAIRIGIDICDALISCDEHRIIHRDIKPDNIFRSETGSYKLGDFGAARRLDRTFGSYTTRGTFSYMAPEIYRQERYDSRVDLYSLGIVLYRFMNRNRDPFIDPEKHLIYYQDRENALKRRMEGEPLPPPVDASQDFAYVIRKACAFLPGKRFPDAAAMKTTLLHLLEARGSTSSSLFDDTARTVNLHNDSRADSSPDEERMIEGLGGTYQDALIPMKPGESLVIGRDIQHCNLVLDGADISRIHCTISLDSKGRYYYVTDHSKNGTWMNSSDRLVKEAAFRCVPGTLLSLGDGRNRFMLK